LVTRLAQIRDWLLPGRAEQDEGFRQEMLSASYRGVRVVAVVEAAIAVGSLAGWMPRTAAFAVLMLAFATLGASRLTAFYPFNRLVAAISTASASVIAVRSIAPAASGDYALGASAALLLVAVTTVPLRPIECLLMGAAPALAGLGGGHVEFFALVALAATVLAASVYGQRRAHYALYVDMLHDAAALREYQSQAMRAESSETMVRLTAALAHDLSQPIGALSSGIDTLIAVSARQAVTPPEGQERLVRLQADLRKSLQESLERLRKTVNRIQRLTNLDEAVTQQANLNELVHEAVGLMKPQSPEGTRFELELGVLPDVTCRPQRLMAVLCSLLSNSIRAVNGNGRIAISTQRRDAVLEVKIQDNGHGIPAGQLAHIFDPRFEEAGGRVATGNWSLFMSKQYIKEHGGDIGIQSLEGKGTTVWLTLPAAS
jgi:signal transduction histidine kinase